MGSSARSGSIDGSENVFVCSLAEVKTLILSFILQHPRTYGQYHDNITVITVPTIMCSLCCLCSCCHGHSSSHPSFLRLLLSHLPHLEGRLHTCNGGSASAAGGPTSLWETQSDTKTAVTDSHVNMTSQNQEVLDGGYGLTDLQR